MKISLTWGGKQQSMHSFNVKPKSFGEKFHRKQIWLEKGANPNITSGPSCRNVPGDMAAGQAEKTEFLRKCSVICWNWIWDSSWKKEKKTPTGFCFEITLGFVAAVNTFKFLFIFNSSLGKPIWSSWAWSSCRFSLGSNSKLQIQGRSQTEVEFHPLQC